jgi:uncharacterized membrane protein HdeD (DUF308 family)
MNIKVIGIVLLVAGFILVICGLNAANIMGSTLAETLTNVPSPKTLWFLITGVFAAIIGLTLTLSNFGKSPKN